VAENNEGYWELVDGLQRISTILSFFGLLKNVPEEKNHLILQKGKIIKELNGLTIDTIPFRLKILLKRATIGVEF